MLVKLFGTTFEFPKLAQRFEAIKPPTYRCSVDTCAEFTDGSFKSNVRERWMLGVTIGDEDEKEIVNLCPVHVRKFFGMTEEGYKAIELGESLAENKIGVEEWKNAISSFRG